MEKSLGKSRGKITDNLFVHISEIAEKSAQLSDWLFETMIILFQKVTKFQYLRLKVRGSIYIRKKKYAKVRGSKKKYMQRFEVRKKNMQRFEVRKKKKLGTLLLVNQYFSQCFLQNLSLLDYTPLQN